MSALLQWFTSPEWSQVVTALLHSLWQGALIALVLAIGLRRVANPALRYRCSSAALLGVMMAGIVTWAVLAASSRQTSDLSQGLLTDHQPKANFSIPAISDGENKLIVTTALRKSEKSFHWNAWLAFAWLVGAGLMLVRTGVRVAGAGQLRRSCRPVDDAQVEKLLGEARRALGMARRVRVGVTNRLTSPAVVGVFVPMLVLPLSLVSTLTPEQIRFVLLHELAHVRRGDYLANLFQFFAESLLFFNPAVWWISHQMRREREACCDALAIQLSGAPADYARTLVQVAENVLNSTPAAAPAFGTKRGSSSLIERVERMLVPGYQPSLRLTWRAMLAALALGSTLLVLSAVGTRTTVAAILATELVPASESEATTPTSSQSAGKSNTVYEVKKDAETEQQFRDGLDRLEILAVKLRMPPTMAKAAMHVDGDILVQMFETESHRKYLPFAEMKRELDAMDHQGRENEMKVLLQMVDAGISRKPIDYSDPQAINDGIRSIEKQRAAFQPQVDEGRENMEALGKQYGISEPVDFNQVTEKNFSDYASYLMAKRELNHRTKFATALAMKVEDLKQRTNTAQNFKEPVSLSGRRVEAIYPTNIAARLETIHMQRVSYDNAPLSEVLSGLSKYLKEVDPDGKGITFIASEEIKNLPITLEHDLINPRLKDVLDAIVKSSASPIHYTSGDHAVVFAPGKSDEQLLTRWFKIEPNTLQNNLKERVGPGVTNDNGTGMIGAREYFQQAGVDLGKPKALFYNDKAGVLVVRATSKDLDIIERAISELSDQQPMVNSRATNVDLPDKAAPQLYVRNFKIKPDAFFSNLRKREGSVTNITERATVALLKVFAEAGVEIKPPKSLYLNQKGMVLVRATSNDLDTIEVTLAGLNYAPPQILIKTRFIELPDGLARALMAEYAAIATNNIVVGNFSAVLTPEQVKQLLARCERAPDVNIMSLMEVTTVNGQQAEVQMVDVMTLVKGLKPEALTPPGVTNQTFYQTEQMLLGQTINFIPRVLADESGIQLSAVPRLIEFVRYEGPTNSVAVYMKGKKAPVTAVIPRPHYRAREMAVSTTLPDGQTLLMGGAPWTDTMTRIDGTIETKTMEDAGHRQLFVLVTPTLITPEGNLFQGEELVPIAHQVGK